ncbi:DUF4843 domain-containing protein [Chitinophaga sp. SYP-B3965]|uniref:DUF4843 domain-containing protein n=1 Tax=Chitinophaga sp. SYP-B3965 TaxID=2663120 RepID=UPI001299852B|nr:DUF4843 domain-containing protein [Chitinophaga sp. SYP-B3965]MRG43565.1 DUF4843 domain-containing protein [Chitinophaga sp. SYP-B3965]
MTKRYITALVLWMAAMSACKKQDIPTYSGERYVQFVNAQQDTASLSFFFYPNQGQVILKLPVKLTGMMTTEDLHYKIEIDTATTASADHYNLAQEFVFRKGMATDTAFLTIINKPDLATNMQLVAVRITGGNGVQAGQTAYVRRIFKISDMVSKPAWWDAAMETTYLGKYTERKFRKFMEVTNIGDLSGLTPGEQRGYMLEFKYYLIQMKDAGTPVLEDDGTDMLSTVKIIG